MDANQVRLNDALKLIGYAIDSFNKIKEQEDGIAIEIEWIVDEAIIYLKNGIEKIFEN